MKPPRCRLCGVEHALGAEHVFPDSPPPRIEKEVKLARPKRAINTAPRANAAINAPAINAVVDGKTPNRRARAIYNEYMRGYMARYRAARRNSAGAA